DTRAAGGGGHAEKLAVQVEELGRTQPVVEAEELGQVADLAARFAVAERPAEDAAAAAAGRGQAGEELDGGRLAGAVGAEEAEDLTAGDGEGQTVERHLGAVLLAQAIRGDGHIRCRGWVLGSNEQRSIPGGG